MFDPIFASHSYAPTGVSIVTALTFPNYQTAGAPTVIFFLLYAVALHDTPTRSQIGLVITAIGVSRERIRPANSSSTRPACHAASGSAQRHEISKRAATPRRRTPHGRCQ